MHPLLPVLEVSVEYKPVVRTGRRVLDVARAFGLGERSEHYTIFKDFKLEWDDPAIIYVTGESGGGKTTLLKAFKNLYGDRCVDMDDVAVDDGEVLCESIGMDTGEALYFLGIAGLGEAMLFVRSYGELSAGQKYRYKLAKTFYKAVVEGRDAIAIDEFCSLLDRLTARAVAYTAQKFARRFGRTLIAASSHTDLIDDLNPDIIVVKPFLKPPIVERRGYEPKPFSLLSEVSITEGGVRDYRELEVFHYKGFTPAYIAKIFKALYRDGNVGVIVYSYPPLESKARRRVFGSNLRSYAKSGRLLRISRVVAHPSWRGVGLGVRLVSETLHLCGADIVETEATMAVYNPFFEKAGMKLGSIEEVPYTDNHRLLDDTLRRYGFDPMLRISWQRIYEWLSNLTYEEYVKLQADLYRIQAPKAYGDLLRRKHMLKSGSVSRRRLATYIHRYPVPGTQIAYYYWVNPRVEAAKNA
jgi:ABC-type ATPase with predicted acetyltransferase domain